jgi:hypothetical protein
VNEWNQLGERSLIAGAPRREQLGHLP